MLATNSTHLISGHDMFGAYPDGMEQVQLGMGCFWGAERILWKLDGVHVTSVGYAGGHTTDPDYKKTCTGTTETAYGRPVTTELRDAPTYYPAEDYHQQYLKKNPQGYCMHGPTGIVCQLPERV